MDVNTFEEFKEYVEQHGFEAIGLYYGMYRGFVADNKDPEFRGRVKVICPPIYGDDVMEYWANSRGQYAGSGAGFFLVPKVGDQIWITFENGNARFPVWEHGWFGQNDVPLAAKTDSGEPNNQVWQSYSGHRIELDDEKKLVRIFNKEGELVELNETGISLISDKIALGTLNSAAEPSVLGDKLMNLLNDLITDIGNLGTIITSTGVTSTISTSPQWIPLVTKWQTKFEEFKSQKVTLD